MNMKSGNYTPSNMDYGKKFQLNGEELGFRILDFWRWSQSDLVENRNRGVLAEFLVKQALGIEASEFRLEWDGFDFETDDKIKIEVKSSAYLQSWEQKKYSNITFSIAPKKTLLEDGNYSEKSTRHSDVYVFCLLKHKDFDTIDPMKLEQWSFYLVLTKTLDEKLGGQKTIGLNSLKNLNCIECDFNRLKLEFDKMGKRLAEG